MGARYVLCIIQIPHANLYKSESDFGEQEVLRSAARRHAVTLTEGNPRVMLNGRKLTAPAMKGWAKAHSHVLKRATGSGGR